MTTTLTKRQQEVLDWVRQSIELMGYPPTLRDIAAHFAFSGPRAAEKHLLALAKKGFIRRGKGARAIEVLGQRISGVSLPILGQVAAGQPILATENIEGHLTVDQCLVKNENSYLLRVKGESMKDAGILDGDYLMVHPQPDADSGKIVVAMLDGEVTVKELVKEKDCIVLKPHNTAFQPIVISDDHIDFKILGVSGGLIRINP